MRKVKYSNILILGVFIYIIFQVLLLILGKTTTTFLLENEDLEAKITKKGLIIRNEYLVKAPESGELNLSAKEHEKVRKSQNIGSIYMSNNIEDLNKDINELNKEIEELEKTSKSSKNKSSKLSNEITLKNLQTKKEQKEVLISKKNKNMKNINSSISGILSYKFDENEEKYNLESLNSISKEDIKSANNNFQETNENEEKVKEGDTVARIVDNNNMYIAVCVDKKESKLFKINQDVCIGLK
ncbi:HlyD family efflux transporter periplasmic adaptor subunit, partial [Clostridium sp. CCUG 7971]|uniref:HlyD family efflux transporter periplasmic adaptor subunit n=1 Tax=Clostridium sp. CCUG 7971 TaxID=2811414 RepID=UPI001ABB8966